jgi:hypothetical protein
MQRKISKTIFCTVLFLKAYSLNEDLTFLNKKSVALSNGGRVNCSDVISPKASILQVENEPH